jgi:Icc-related predicted phosphoesterase
LIIDCISDLHGFYPQLEGGDLLIVAGDLTSKHTFNEYAFEFITWLSKQEYKRKIVIAGNHDTFLGTGAEDAMKPFCEYLCDSGTEFIETFSDERNILTKRSWKIWGSPWTKTFPGMNPHCKAFTLDSEQELEEKWRMIPPDIDILITHEPPYGIFDEVTRDTFIEGHQCDKIEHVGSHSLLYYSRMHQPKLHVFGHIHEGYGQKKLDDIIPCINASHVNERYQPVNPPIRIIL